MPASPVIELSHVYFSYDGSPVLEDVNLAVKERELVSIVGPNGGGKTTLLKIILGLLKPQRGEVRVLGQTPASARHRLGYVPQMLHYDQMFPMLVREVVLMGRLGGPGLVGWLGFRRRADREAAHQALAQVKMENFAHRPFADLSGGERQRVLIARALVSEPEILLLDEPTASIDLEVEERLSQIIAELKERITILMVSHDPWFVSSLVEHVVCVNRTAVVHPTGRLEGVEVQDFYGRNLRLVHHHHICPDRDHSHE